MVTDYHITPPFRFWMPLSGVYHHQGDHQGIYCLWLLIAILVGALAGLAWLDIRYGSCRAMLGSS
jgi:hypothetical protein